MAVYISKPYAIPGIAAWKKRTRCDMIGDRWVELIKMAEKLNMNEFDAQYLKEVPFFHISEFDRQQATDYRAHLCTDEFFKEKMKQLIKESDKS